MRKYDRIPQPFVLRLHEAARREFSAGDALGFGIRLFGPAAELHPYVVHAVQNMLSRGLGRSRSTFGLQSVTDTHREVYRAGQSSLQAVETRSVEVQSDPAGEARCVDLRFATPLRLRINGRITAVPTLESILRATVRRARVLAHFYGNGQEAETPRPLLDASRRAKVSHQELRAEEIRRYSGRQDRKMVLRGVLGNIRYTWPAGEPGPQGWLGVAEVLHIGKATTFGFGQIECTVET